MKKKWIKRISLVVMIPILMFSLLIACLYIPYVQNFIQKKATGYASEATGLNISIGRIDLRFPLNLLLRDVSVVDKKDTLLALQSLNVGVEVLPLFKKQVMLKNLALEEAILDSKKFIDGIEIRGSVGSFELDSRLIDLDSNYVDLKGAYLDRVSLFIGLTDTATTPADTTNTPLDWRFLVENVELENSWLELDMQTDTLYLFAEIPSLLVKDINIDLLSPAYKIGNINLSDGMFHYKMGKVFRDKGFDANNVELQNISLQVDSVAYLPALIQANIQTFYFHERSGLSINSLDGSVKISDKEVVCDNFRIKTPKSSVQVNTHFPIDWCNESKSTKLDLDVRLDMKELAQFIGVDSVNAEIATWGSIIAKVEADGNSSRLVLNELYAELSNSFIMTMQGAFKDLCKNKSRNGQVDLLGDFYDLTRFEKWVSDDSSIKIPKEVVVKGVLGVNGGEFYSELSLVEGKGTIDLKGRYHIDTEAYQIEASVDSVDVVHFMPSLPLEQLIVRLNASGQGIDLFSPKSTMDLDFSLNSLRYENLFFRDVDLKARLDKGQLNTDFLSHNNILKGKATGYYWLTKPIMNLEYQVDIDDIDLYKLGISSEKMKEPVKMSINARADNDSVHLALNSGDLDFVFSAKKSINALLDLSTRIFDSISEQAEKRDIDFVHLQSELPNANLSWTLGPLNPLSELLSQQSIRYLNSIAEFKMDPIYGTSGRFGIGKFQMDSVKLDSLLFTLEQDTTGIRAVAGIINDQKTETGFKALLRGILNPTSGSLELDIETANSDAKGLLFGMKAKPLNKGAYITLTPKEPIVAFSKFKFEDKKNWLALREDFRLFADIDMMNKNQIGFKMSSNLKDTTSLQNMNVDIRRIHLNDITRLFPFLPRLDGFLSAETHYIQTDSTLQISSEFFLDSLKYEKKLIGDVSLGATWLPDGSNADLINMYLTHNGIEVMMVDGYVNRASKKEALDVNVSLAHFPLKMANVFFSSDELLLDGDFDGYLQITGNPESPKINGEIILDSVTVHSRQGGASFLLDNRPIEVKDNKIILKDFAIYSTDNNPFRINGIVDIADLSNPKVDLKLKALNYTLIDAKRTKESILYGKLLVGMDATVKGPLNGLKMRGSMSLLDNTDFTYILTESPLTVQDRLGDLVEFTSFNDTTTQVLDTVPRALGGLDMVMNVHIDPSVQLKVDLTSDRSSRIALQGGGDLSLQYTPQGDFFLNGRYSLTGGVLKYSLPVIPSKEFAISNESYIEWSGKVDNPKLNLVAKDRVRASVSEADGSSHMVNFDVIIGAKNRLDNLELIFDVSSPENYAVQNELVAMGKEERGKQAIALLATGVYLANSGNSKGGLNMSAALNSVLQSQINALAGSSLKNASFSLGVEEYDMSEAGGKRTDYSFSYSQRFMNNRFQLNLGGRVKTGVQAENDIESFIDNISLEYRLDSSGNRLVRVFHNKNYESVLDGEIKETGVGIILRKKLSRLRELFIFKKKKKAE